MTAIQRLVDQLQRELKVHVPKGSITLNMADGVFQNAEARICGLAPQKAIDKSAQSAQP